MKYNVLSSPRTYLQEDKDTKTSNDYLIAIKSASQSDSDSESIIFSRNNDSAEECQTRIQVSCQWNKQNFQKLLVSYKSQF